MRSTHGTITFRNNIQAALYEHEIVGQLSDGMWENTRPYDHWRCWGNAEVRVTEDGRVGRRGFYPRKDNYNLTGLVQYIGDRMVNICNLAENGYSASTISRFQDVWSEDYFDRSDSEYMKKSKRLFEEAFGDWEGYQKALKGSYDVKKLRKELKDMKTIMKTQFPA